MEVDGHSKSWVREGEGIDVVCGTDYLGFSSLGHLGVDGRTKGEELFDVGGRMFHADLTRGLPS
jgi:hypothetical protein